MTVEAKLEIENCNQVTSDFNPKSVQPIGSIQSSNEDRIDRSILGVFGSRFDSSPFFSRFDSTSSQKMSVLYIGLNRIETESRLFIIMIRELSNFNLYKQRSSFNHSFSFRLFKLYRMHRIMIQYPIIIFS